MSVLAIIPARMGSSRFPGKPLAKINGRPMIEHVYKNVIESNMISKTIVATCDTEIFNFIKSINGNVIMTSKKHQRASDRCFEAMQKYEKQVKKKFDIILMVQGDEPMINKSMIKNALKPIIKNKKINVINLMTKIKTKKDFYDPNCVKLVHCKNNTALFFSRSAIPFLKSFNAKNLKKQVCVIPFRRNFLFKYNSMKQTKLEIIESIDMLRVIENGYKVHLVESKKDSYPVDTLKDLKKVEKILK